MCCSASRSIAQAIGLADDHGVERDAADQRLLGRLAQQLLELADDHVAELARRVWWRTRICGLSLISIG